jgi:hypothetical protein
MILPTSSTDVAEALKAIRRHQALGVSIAGDQLAYPNPRLVYAPVSMTELKVSVTASIGMQARRRMLFRFRKVHFFFRKRSPLTAHDFPRRKFIS